MERLKQAVGQGRTGQAACQLTVLQSVANQVLDDMEDKEVVPNRLKIQCDGFCAVCPQVS